ncbi:MAG: ribosome-associated translation inhibitor RaiA [Solirubrobacterales bacterium]|nr:ribosome-associated translation inhibitor RaiA [Solirubrobacterales bacterium]HMT04701.1 ribosome-associated translation inhibitor RaiA [Solirubrobacterales bacterium]
MRIEIRGRNVDVNDELREQVAQRFKRLGEQVSPLARIEVVVSEEQNPAIADKFVAEATLHVKGVTLHAHEASPDMTHTIHELAEDMRRQVKRHREKRRKRRETRKLVNQLQGRDAGGAQAGM